jgi:hypothetical protein
MKLLAPTNPHWAQVVGYSPFSLWLIHKEGLCPSSWDINRLMMIIIKKHSVSVSYVSIILSVVLPTRTKPGWVASKIKMIYCNLYYNHNYNSGYITFDFIELKKRAKDVKKSQLVSPKYPHIYKPLGFIPKGIAEIPRIFLR